MKNELVTWDNYEEYLLLQVDGELNDAGRQALRVFIAANPEVEEELEMYAGAKLAPDMAVAFEDKEVLLKRERRVVAFPGKRWVFAAAAAVAGIVMMLPVFRTTKDLTGRQAFVLQQQMPKQFPAAQPAKQLPEPPIPMVVEDAATGIAVMKKRNDPPQNRTAIPVQREEAIAQLEAATSASIITNPAPMQPLPAMNTIEQPRVVIVVAQNDEPKEHKQGVVRFAPENAAAFQTLKGLLANNLEKVHQATNRLKETALNLKMGNTNITINF